MTLRDKISYLHPSSPSPASCDDDHLKIFHKMYATFSQQSSLSSKIQRVFVRVKKVAVKPSVSGESQTADDDEQLN